MRKSGEPIVSVEVAAGMGLRIGFWDWFLGLVSGIGFRDWFSGSVVGRALGWTRLLFSVADVIELALRWCWFCW